MGYKQKLAPPQWGRELDKIGKRNESLDLPFPPFICLTSTLLTTVGRDHLSGTASIEDRIDQRRQQGIHQAPKNETC